MENLPAPGLTKAQFQKAMLDASDGDAFSTEINDRELTKLLQEHASDKIKLKVSKGQVFQVWVLDPTKSKLTAEDKAALREGVLAYGV